MMRLSVFTVIVTIGLGGCGTNPGKVADAVPVKGQVTFGNGKPVRDVLLTLQPMDAGSMAGLKVASNGTFSGKVVPGKYAYFFAAQDGKAAALNAVPKEFHSPHSDRTVVVGSNGGDLELKLN